MEWKTIFIPLLKLVAIKRKMKMNMMKHRNLISLASECFVLFYLLILEFYMSLSLAKELGRTALEKGQMPFII